MTSSITCTESDYVSAQIAWLKLHPLRVLRGFWCPVAILIVAAVAVVYGRADLPAEGIVVLIAVGMSIVVLMATQWRWHGSYRKTKWMHQPLSVTVNGEGIRLKGENFETLENWTAVRKICETPCLFLFLLPNKRFFFLPKRGLTERQLAGIRNAAAAMG